MGPNELPSNLDAETKNYLRLISNRLTRAEKELSVLHSHKAAGELLGLLFFHFPEVGDEVVEQLKKLRAEQIKKHDDAVETLNTFLSEYPDAELHLDTLRELLEIGPPEMTLKDAYQRLRNFYSAKGMDWKLPLGDYEKGLARAVSEELQINPE